MRLTLAAIAALTLALCAPLRAEEPTFASREEAESALCTGHFTPYAWRSPATSPVEGEEKRTETPLVGELATPHGWRWVPIPTGTLLLWKEGIPVGWGGCRNPLRTWAFPRPCPTPQPTLTGLPSGRLMVDINVHHDGEVTVRHEGTVKLDQADKPPKGGKYHGWCAIWTHEGCTALAVVGAVGGFFGVRSLTQGGSSAPRGKGNTLP